MASRPELARYGLCTLDLDGCVTCGDVAVPVVVVEVDGLEAVCEDRLGQQARIAIDLTPEAVPGDVLLVHLGVAIARVGRATP